MKEKIKEINMSMYLQKTTVYMLLGLSLSPFRKIHNSIIDISKSKYLDYTTSASIWKWLDYKGFMAHVF